MCLGPNLFKASHLFRSDLPSLKNNLDIFALVAAAKLARLANHALVLLLKRYYAVRASTIVCPTLSRLARSASSLQIWFLSPAPIVCGAPFATDQGRVEPDPSVAKRGQKKERQTCNIWQTEAMLGVLFRHVSSGRLCYWRVPLRCPLQMADRATGETTKLCLEESMQIPLLNTMREKFGVRLEASTCDRASSNLRAEAALRTQNQVPRMTLGCDIHKLSTVQGRVYGPIDVCISGLISFSLVMRPWGASKNCEIAWST